MNQSHSLAPEEDAYGQMLRACHIGEEVYEIAERDDGYISVSTLPKVYFSDYPDWTAIEREAMGFVKGKVLDIGCGAGRHSLYLQTQGFDVLGIDNSPLAIQLCKLRGVKKLQVRAIEDIDFSPNSFDTIIMMGNNFGLLGGFQKAQKLLRRFSAMTSADALIIANTRDPYNTDKPVHLEYHRKNKEKGRMGGQVRIRIRFSSYVGRWFDYLLVSREEMKQILAGTDWSVQRFLDSGNAEYIAVLEKKG